MRLPAGPLSKPAPLKRSKRSKFLSPGLDTSTQKLDKTSTHPRHTLDTLDTPFPDSMIRMCQGSSLDTLDTLDSLDTASTPPRHSLNTASTLQL